VRRKTFEETQGTRVSTPFALCLDHELRARGSSRIGGFEERGPEPGNSDRTDKAKGVKEVHAALE